MPHEKIYKQKHANAPKRELRIHWATEPFPEYVFIDLYRDDEMRATMGLEEEDVENLIGFLQKAKRKLWPKPVVADDQPAPYKVLTTYYPAKNIIPGWIMRNVDNARDEYSLITQVKRTYTGVGIYYGTDDYYYCSPETPVAIFDGTINVPVGATASSLTR